MIGQKRQNEKGKIHAIVHDAVSRTVRKFSDKRTYYVRLYTARFANGRSITAAQRTTEKCRF